MSQSSLVNHFQDKQNEEEANYVGRNQCSSQGILPHEVKKPSDHCRLSQQDNGPPEDLVDLFGPLNLVGFPLTHAKSLDNREQTAQGHDDAKTRSDKAHDDVK